MLAAFAFGTAITMAWAPSATDDAPKEGLVLIRVHDPKLLERPELRSLEERGQAGLAVVDRSEWHKLEAAALSRSRSAVQAGSSASKTAAKQGPAYEILDQSFSQRIQAERSRLQQNSPSPPEDLIYAPQKWLADYRPLAEIYDALRFWSALDPRCTLVDFGQSAQGRPILGVTLRPLGTPPDAPHILVLATQHAREWLATMSAMVLLSKWGSQWMTQSAASGLQLTVVPVVNPDGYVHTWNKSRLWRKNRRPLNDPQKSTGVDLNRNWGQSWGNSIGASANPGSSDYHGPAAFSEPETRALRDWSLQHPELAAVLDVHTYGQWVIYPGSCDKAVSWGKKDFAYVAGHFAERISKQTRAWYTPIQGIDFEYPACGDASDWFAESRQTYAFTLELRPSQGSVDGFIQHPSAIAGSGEDLWLATKDLADWVRYRKLTPLPGSSKAKPEAANNEANEDDDPGHGPKPDHGNNANPNANQDFEDSGCACGLASGGIRGQNPRQWWASALFLGVLLGLRRRPWPRPKPKPEKKNRKRV